MPRILIQKSYINKIIKTIWNSISSFQLFSVYHFTIFDNSTWKYIVALFWLENSKELDNNFTLYDFGHTILAALLHYWLVSLVSFKFEFQCDPAILWYVYKIKFVQYSKSNCLFVSQISWSHVMFTLKGISEYESFDFRIVTSLSKHDIFSEPGI